MENSNERTEQPGQTGQPELKSAVSLGKPADAQFDFMAVLDAPFEDYYVRASHLTDVVRRLAKVDMNNRTLVGLCAGIMLIGAVAEQNKGADKLKTQLHALDSDLAPVMLCIQNIHPELHGRYVVNQPTAKAAARLIAFFMNSIEANGLFNWRGRIIRRLLGVA